MATKKLYVENVYIKSGKLKLLSFEESEDRIKAVFESTFFYPEGGGQLCDTGVLAGYRVIDVKEDKATGKIIHTLEKTDCSEELIPGQEYEAELDWERRFKHMQMHCGEHLISGAFHKLFKAENKGFHMGEEYVTIDIKGEEELSDEMIKKAELLANQNVWLDLPVETRFFKTSKEAMSLPCRKEIKFDEDISVVLIGSEDDPADCCACCGTHPSTTGQIGLIKITHREKYKGMDRFYVKFGKEALLDYSKKQELTERLGKKFSCEMDKIENAIISNELRNEELYKKYSSLKSYCMKQAEEEILAELKKEKTASIRIMEFTQFSSDDLQTLGRKLEAVISDVLVLTASFENTCIICSPGKPDCGKLVKDNASIYHGKGGGKANLARAIFTNREDLELFLDLLEKHLR